MQGGAFDSHATFPQARDEVGDAGADAGMVSQERLETPQAAGIGGIRLDGAEVAGCGVGKVLAQFHQLAQRQIIGRFLLGGPGQFRQMSNLDKRLAQAGGGGVQTNQVPPHKYFGALFGFELTEQLWLGQFTSDRGGCVGHGRFGHED